MSYITRLQSKPEAQRKQILLVSLISVMAVVVFIWGYNVSDHIKSDTAVKTEDSLKPFTMFANSLSNTYDSISASVSKVPSKEKTVETPERKQIDLKVVDPDTQK